MNEAQEAVVGAWYYEEKGKREGPITEAEIARLVQTAVISHGATVWKTGFPNWLKIEDTELSKYLDHSIPPPLLGEGVNNTIVWVLAFAPIFGRIIEDFIADMHYGDYWFITLILNIALAYLDEGKLNQAGHNTEKLKGWVWIVPVYLYQRAKATKQNLAYFIVWIACFVLVQFI